MVAYLVYIRTTGHTSSGLEGTWPAAHFASAKPPAKRLECPTLEILKLQEEIKKTPAEINYSRKTEVTKYKLYETNPHGGYH